MLELYILEYSGVEFNDWGDLHVHADTSQTTWITSNKHNSSKKVNKSDKYFGRKIIEEFEIFPLSDH